MLKESCTLCRGFRGEEGKGGQGHSRSSEIMGKADRGKEEAPSYALYGDPIRIVRDTAAAGYLRRSMAKGISFCLASQLKKKLAIRGNVSNSRNVTARQRWQCRVQCRKRMSRVNRDLV